MKRAPPRDEDDSSDSGSDGEAFAPRDGAFAPSSVVVRRPDPPSAAAAAAGVDPTAVDRFDYFDELFPELQDLVLERAGVETVAALSITSRGKYHQYGHDRPTAEKRLETEAKMARTGNQVAFEQLVPYNRRIPALGRIMMAHGHVDMFFATMDITMNMQVFASGVIGLLQFPGCTERLLFRAWNARPALLFNGGAGRTARRAIVSFAMSNTRFLPFFAARGGGVLRDDFMVLLRTYVQHGAIGYWQRPPAVAPELYQYRRNARPLPTLELYEFMQADLSPRELETVITPPLLSAEIATQRTPIVTFLLANNAALFRRKMGAEMFYTCARDLLETAGCTEALLRLLWAAVPDAFVVDRTPRCQRFLLTKRVCKHYPQFWPFFFDPPTGVMRAEFIDNHTLSFCLYPTHGRAPNMALFEYANRTLSAEELAAHVYMPFMLAIAINAGCMPLVTLLVDRVEPNNSDFDASLADYPFYYNEPVFRAITGHPRHGHFYILYLLRAAYFISSYADDNDVESNILIWLLRALQRVRTNETARFPTEDEVIEDMRHSAAEDPNNARKSQAENRREYMACSNWVRGFFLGEYLNHYRRSVDEEEEEEEEEEDEESTV